LSARGVASSGKRLVVPINDGKATAIESSTKSEISFDSGSSRERLVTAVKTTIHNVVTSSKNRLASPLTVEQLQPAEKR
jgi:hypothetical protein